MAELRRGPGARRAEGRYCNAAVQDGGSWKRPASTPPAGGSTSGVRLLPSNRRWANYDAICELASGGMASVHLARRTGARGDSGLVAVKVLHGHLQDDDQHRELFRREAELIAQIRHPNVASLIEFGEQAGEPYLVMEYVEGSTLATLQAHAARTGSWLKPSSALTICIDALAGLHAAHSLRDQRGQTIGIVHRDVSPQNILVGVGGQAKVVDFGIALTTSLGALAPRPGDRQAGAGDSEALRGRLAYMSPEHMLSQQVDARADVYAVGIVLWELLTAKRLFKHRHNGASLSQIELAPSIRTVKPELPAGLEACVARALEREPAARYPSCDVFADALEAAMEAARIEPSRREVSELVLGASGRELELRRASARAASTAESGPRQSEGLQASAAYGAEGSSPSATRLGGAYSETPPPVSYDEASVAPPQVLTQRPASSYPAAPSPGIAAADISHAGYQPQAGFIGPHGSVPPPPAVGVGASQAPPAIAPTGSKAWQWVLVIGLATLVCSLLAIAWQRSNPPEASVITPGASPTPTSAPEAQQPTGRSASTATAKPAESALSLDDIPVYQGPARSHAGTPQGAAAPHAAEAPQAAPAPPPEAPRGTRTKPDVDLSNPYR